MKNGFAYGCLAALLLALFSCTREEQGGEHRGGTIEIRFSTSELQVTRATTPGDVEAHDGGGFSDYYMSFEAPDAGTLKIWASNTDASSQQLGIFADGLITRKTCAGTSKPADEDAFSVNVAAKGRVTVFPYNGVSRIYKMEYQYKGDNPATPAVETNYDLLLTWDFGNATFQSYLSSALHTSAIPPAVAAPALNTAATWMVSIDGLTIWSKRDSTWDTTLGCFEWGGYYDSNQASAPVDLVILIADMKTGSATYGNIIATYPASTREEAGVVVTGTIKSQSPVDAVVKFNFTGFDYGDADSWDYMVYAFGNTDGLWTMTTDPENPGIALSASDLVELTTADDVEALQFTAQTRNTEAWDDGALLQSSGRLPVSAKASLTVSSGKNGEAYLELLRCVAKVTAKIINNTGDVLSLCDYTHVVKGINPDTGWVIPHENDVIGTAGNLVANPNAKYSPADVRIPITSEGSREYDWYVFPSTGPYTIDIQFTLNKGEGGEKTYTYLNLPVTNWRDVSIPALARNQHLVVTTRISRGLTVSFNFDVESWTGHTASVEFD